MSDYPLISIVVPVYNTESYLRRCFDSISRQTYSNLEIIVIDDGSSDGSAVICDEYAKKDSRFKVVHKDNEGVSKARNLALEIANGEYIGFVDSDDTVEADMYELLYTRIRSLKADVAICDMSKIINEKSEKWSQFCEVTIFDSYGAIKEILSDGAFIGSTWNKLFKKDILNGLRFDEDIHFAEDTLFVIQAFLKSEKIVFDPVPKYNYYIRENSACTSIFNVKTFTFHMAYERILKVVEKSSIYENLKEQIYTTMMLCDITLIEKLYYAKSEREKYVGILQKSLNENFKYDRIKDLTIPSQISIILAKRDINLFYLWFSIKEKIKIWLR